MSTDRHANNFAAHFPTINRNATISYYKSSLNPRLPKKTVIERIIRWLNKFDIPEHSLTADDLIFYHNKLCDRITDLQSNNKHPSIIDLSLFEIFAPTKDIAAHEYSKYKINKTSKMISICNEFPELTRGATLEFQINKHGVEKGSEIYADYVARQKQSSKRCVEHWLKLGFTEEESRIKVSETQSTFSLDKCIKKHGIVEGTRIWQDRQDRWQQTLNSKSDEEKKTINKKKNSCSLESFILRGKTEQAFLEFMKAKQDQISSIYYSKESISFFYKNIQNMESCRVADKEWFIYSRELDRRYFYDLTNLDKKLIVEYHGETFHPNPDVLNDKEFSEWKHPYSKEPAHVVMARDVQKRELAESNGFAVVEIWSNDPQDVKALKVKIINDILNS